MRILIAILCFAAFPAFGADGDTRCEMLKRQIQEDRETVTSVRDALFEFALNGPADTVLQEKDMLEYQLLILLNRLEPEMDQYARACASAEKQEAAL